MYRNIAIDGIVGAEYSFQPLIMIRLAILSVGSQLKLNRYPHAHVYLLQLLCH